MLIVTHHSDPVTFNLLDSCWALIIICCFAFRLQPVYHSIITKCKLADNTTVMNLISKNDTTYKEKVERLAKTYRNHNLSPSVEKTKYIVADYRRSSAQLPPRPSTALLCRVSRIFTPFPLSQFGVWFRSRALFSTSSSCFDSQRTQLSARKTGPRAAPTLCLSETRNCLCWRTQQFLEGPQVEPTLNWH